jgi:Transposase IS200 like
MDGASAGLKARPHKAQGFSPVWLQPRPRPERPPANSLPGKMPQSLHCKYGHIVFSTKSRQPIIAADLEPRLFEYLGGIVRGLKARLIEINGTANHLHFTNP